MIGATRPAGLKTRLYERDSVLSSELQVALAPTASYQRFLSSSGSGPAEAGHYVRSLRRPAMVVLVIAVMSPIMAVQHVTVGLVATAALSWSFAVVLQSIVGLGIIASAPARRITVLAALDLWFAGHVPYSLWIMVGFAAITIMPFRSLGVLIGSAIVPAIWTAFIVAAFCRTVLGTTASGARWRAAAHFVSIWAITSSYIAWAAGGWFQLLP
ncbi:MAG TPA: hypothetical protein VH436_30270 [Vicinamibacterales bacterium]